MARYARPRRHNVGKQCRVIAGERTHGAILVDRSDTGALVLINSLSSEGVKDLPDRLTIIDPAGERINCEKVRIDGRAVAVRFLVNEPGGQS